MKLSLFSWYAMAFIHNTRVENVEKPVCQQCRYFRNSFLDDPNFGKCTQFGKKNIVSGIIRHEYAELCRKNPQQCGVNGTYFERKPFFPCLPLPPSWPIVLEPTQLP